MKLNEEDARKYVKEIYNNNRKYYTDSRGKGLLRVLDRIHSSHAYVAEILQNAIDANASKIISNVVDSGKLIIEHDGKGFSKNDVKSISEAGTSEKLASDIGFMGIGFKSVYGRFQKAAISSPPWKFYYDCPRKEYGHIDQLNKTLPIWDEEIIDPSPGMTCRFELSKPYIIKDIKPKVKIIGDLNSVMGQNYDLLVMLACQGVQEIIWNNQEWLLEKEEIDLYYKEININKIIAVSDEYSLEWIHLSKSYYLNEAAKNAFYKHRQNEEIVIPKKEKRKVEIFTRLHNNGTPIMKKEGKSFAVLPMGVRLPFSLNVQADWLVDATRKDALENNEWHRLIILQIPELMAGFLKWSTEFFSPKEFPNMYKCLPDFDGNQSKISSWFDEDGFKIKLKNELADLKILPVLTEKGHKYISPKEARFLQGAFDGLEKNKFKPWILLSEQAIFKNLTSKRIKSVLEKLDLRIKMNLEYLIDYWQEYPISEWFTSLEDNNRFEALFRLYEIFNKLYAGFNDKELLESSVHCILLEDGDWDTLNKVFSLPKDWFTFIQKDSDLARELKTKILSKYKLIDEKLLQFNLNEWDNDLNVLFDCIKTLSLKEILSPWWQKITKYPNNHQVNLVLNLTWKAISSNRYALIDKVLCEEENDDLILVEPNKALLSKPYLGGYREKLFQNTPVITNRYINEDPRSRSSSEWLIFFEKLNPVPMGRFKFDFKTTKLKYDKAQAKYEQLGFNKNDLPKHRKTDNTRSKEWEIYDSNSTIEIKNDEYLFVNPDLPENWPAKDSIDYNKAKIFVQWITDSAEKLNKYDSYEIRYIPYGQSSIRTRQINGIKPFWIKKLQHQSWIPEKNYQDVLPPEEILLKHDAARPEAPVADIPIELGESLLKSGIKFGTNIPKAPVLERLKKSHSKLSIDGLYDNLNKAIELAEEDDELKEELDELIKNVISLPGPKNQKLKYYRFTNSTNNPLDNFLISYPGLSDDNKHYKILKLVNDYLQFPKDIKFEQIILYLQYVWGEESNPNEIQNKLKYAYSFINNSISDNQKHKNIWLSVLENAKVYTKNKRWVSINGEELIYYDDFKLNIFEQRLELLEDNFLGSTEKTKLATAENHNIKRLKEDFKVYIIEFNKSHPPKIWTNNLSKIKHLAEEIFDRNLSIPEIKTCEEIKIKIIKENEIWYENKDHRVINDRGVLFVVGRNVSNFARKLTTELLDIWELDDVKFASDFGYLISNLDNERDLTNQINEIRLEKGLSIIEEAQGSNEDKIEDEKEQADIENLDEHKKYEDKKTSRKASLSRMNDSKESSKSSKKNSNIKNRTNKQESGGRSSSSSGYNSDRRTGQINNLLRELESKLDMKILSDKHEEYIEIKNRPSQDFPSDELFRQQVIAYEKRKGRYPEEMPLNHPGYDIVSYEDSNQAKVSRYIEVKGKKARWKGNETVSLTKRQFLDALEHHDSDKPGEYWLYIVEKEDDQYNVITLINPAAKVSLFDLRADHWEWLSKIINIE